jgi:hypothetical protein
MKLKILIVFLLMLTSIYSASALLYVVSGTPSSETLIYKSTDDIYFQLIMNISNPSAYMTTALSNVPLLTASEIKYFETSDDGRFIYVLAKYNSSVSYLLISDDSGVSFHAVYTSLFNYTIRDDILGMTVSGNGQYIYLISSETYHIYRSNHYGQSFSNTLNTGCQDRGINPEIMTSYIGQSVIYGCGYSYHLSEQTFYSTNFGVNWSNFSAVGDNSNLGGWYHNVCISSDGNYLFDKYYDSSGITNMTYSINGGSSWNIRTSGSSNLICKNDSSFLLFGYNNGVSNYASVFNGTAEYSSSISQKIIHIASDKNHLDWIYFDDNSQNIYKTDDKFANTSHIILVTNLSGFPIYDLEYIPMAYNATTPYPPVCLDTTSYCSNPFYLLPDTTPKCSYSDIEYCSGGCADNVCSQTVESECDVVGSRKCVDSTIYAVCSDSDLNGGLDYGETHSCPVNTFCFESLNFASCNNVTSSGVHNPYTINFYPYAQTPDTQAIYTLDATNRVLNVLSNQTVHTQRFYASGTSFVSRTCDYKETQLYSYNTPTYINTSQDYVMNSASSLTTVLRMSLLPDAISNTSLTISAQDNTVNSRIFIVRNATNKQLTIYDNSFNIIYDDYDVTSADTLTSLDLEYTFDAVTSWYSLRMTFNRNSDNVKISYPLTYTGDNIYNVSLISYTNGITSNYVQIQSIPQPSTWTASYNTTEFVQNCNYQTAGTYKVRTYGNQEVSPDYESYSDYTLSIKFVDVGTSLDEQGGVNVFGAGLSKTTKYIIVLLVMLGIIGAFTALGFSIQMIQASFVVGIVASSFALLIFTVLGWVPSYIIVMMIVISIVSIILLSKTPSNNNSAG